MVDKKYIISQDKTLIEALKQINDLVTGPLVLFAIDEQNHMVGTITDGDVRRALINGAQLTDVIASVMNRSFNYVSNDEGDVVRSLHHQRELKMKLVPILDAGKHITDIVNLEKYVTRLPIDAVLMAGGKGERLRPLTEKTPKPLLKVGDKAIIDHNIDRLINYGVMHISVTVNYLKEQLEEHFSEPRGEVQVQTVREPKFLGTIGSIRFVPEFFNDTVLVMNSDLFTNINYEDFYLHFKEHDADMSVAAVPYDVDIPLGILNLDGRNITGLSEKPHFGYYANAGIYLIKKSALELIPEDVMFHSTDLVEALIAAGRKVIRFPLNGTWIDIGTHQEYRRANDMVKYMH